MTQDELNENISSESELTSENDPAGDSSESAKSAQAKSQIEFESESETIEPQAEENSESESTPSQDGAEPEAGNTQFSSDSIANSEGELFPASEVEISLGAVIEAVLFAGDEPISAEKLVDIAGTGGVKEVRDLIEQLNEKYSQMQCSFRIHGLAGGYQMLTQPEFNPWLKKLIHVRSESKLTPAALETLAIIAYKQPVLRVDVESIRGVAAGEMIRQLIEKGLVKIAGRAEMVGRPLLYGTTKKFLQTFGLNSLKDLPTAEELKKPE